MNPPSKPFFTIAFTVFGILAALSLIYVVSRTASPLGATDFHSYWYAGHFVRQRTDPYTAFIKNLHPRTPVTYVDGHIVTELPIAQPGLARVPANTPLMVEILSVFSFFSWPVAKFIWMFCNLIIVLAIPFLAIRLFPRLQSSPAKNKILVVLIFLSLFGTRNTIGNGQTGALICATMLLAISTKKHWLGSIALGIALSKYSLSLPAVILLLLERQYQKIIGGLLLQIFGFLFLGLITGESLVNILKAYFAIVQLHFEQPGIHFIAIFSQELSGWLLTFLVFAIVIITVFHYLSKTKSNPSLLNRPLLRPVLFNVLALWILLTTYHRAYDTLVMITFVAFGAELLLTANNFCRTRQGKVFAIAMKGILTTLILPASGFKLATFNLPANLSAIITTWKNWHNLFVALSVLLALLISIWALYHLTLKNNYT